jgi:hypothetical protein
MPALQLKAVVKELWGVKVHSCMVDVEHLAESARGTAWSPMFFSTRPGLMHGSERLHA